MKIYTIKLKKLEVLHNHIKINGESVSGCISYIKDIKILDLKLLHATEYIVFSIQSNNDESLFINFICNSRNNCVAIITTEKFDISGYIKVNNSKKTHKSFRLNNKAFLVGTHKVSFLSNYSGIVSIFKDDEYDLLFSEDNKMIKISKKEETFLPNSAYRYKYEDKENVYIDRGFYQPIEYFILDNNNLIIRKLLTIKSRTKKLKLTNKSTINILIDDAKNYPFCKFQNLYVIDENMKVNSPQPFVWKQFNNGSKIEKLTDLYKTNNNRDAYKELINFGVVSPTNRITEHKDFTFGVEIETCLGALPDDELENLNVKLDKDMSVTYKPEEKINNSYNRDYCGSGAEYVTGVLYGDAGFAHLRKLVNLLSKYTAINKTCGIHVHIGNNRSDYFNKTFVVNAFYLGLLLQDEIFDMLPNSRKKNEYCKFIQKFDLDFSLLFRKLNQEERKIIYDELYKKIFFLMCGKQIDETYNKNRNHPHGHRAGYDKRNPRYWWLNFIPTMFNTRGNKSFTIEFRNHSASLNYTKIKNWILICMAFVNFSKLNGNIIFSKSKITLETILQYSYPKTYKKLLAYIEERTNYFKKKENEQEDYADKTNKICSLKETVLEM